MPFKTPSNIIPPKGALIVCAGTITCTSVASMGSGFIVFKNFFNKNIHHADQPGGWQTALQQILDQYHYHKREMPAYIRLAKQESYLGGIATVPAKSGNLGLNFEKFSNDEERQASFIKQYKEALRGALLDAQVLKRPLFLQPLGIGVYGWDAQLAATLFAEVITETDPLDQLDITIPIFKPTLGSKDGLFRETFISEMTKRQASFHKSKHHGH